MVNRTAAISTIILGFLLYILAVVIFLSTNQNDTKSGPDPTFYKIVVPTSSPIFNETGDHGANGPTTTFVSTAKELFTALENSVKGSKIGLAEGTYVGQFIVTQDDLVLRGKGPETIIKLDANGTMRMPTIALNVSGNNFQISKMKLLSEFKHAHGMEIHGPGASLSEIQFEGFHTAISSFGVDDKMSNITIKDSEYGIHIYRNRSRLDSIKMNNISVGVSFHGENSTLHSFTCDDCQHAVYITGNYNLIQNVETRRPKYPNMFSGIFVGNGRGNVVDFYTGPEYSVTLGTSSSNGELRNSVSKDVHVMGSGNSLFSVDAGKLLWISHVKGIRIEDSKAVELKNYGINVTFVRSIFSLPKKTSTSSVPILF